MEDSPEAREELEKIGEKIFEFWQQQYRQAVTSSPDMYREGGSGPCREDGAEEGERQGQGLHRPPSHVPRIAMGKPRLEVRKMRRLAKQIGLPAHIVIGSLDRRAR